MKVVLIADISGTRNGQTWPPKGSTVDLPDDEGAQMIRASLARAVVDSEQMTSETTRAAGRLEEILPGPAPDVPGPLTTESGPGRKVRARV